MEADRTARADGRIAVTARTTAPFWSAPPASPPRQGVAERAGRIQRELRDLLGDLLDRSAEPGEHPCPATSVRCLHGEYAIDDFLRSAWQSATTEILLAMPRGAQPRPGPADEVPLRLAASRPGISTRVLLQHTVRFDQATRESVQAATAAGARFRTLDEMFKRFVVVDAKTLIIEADEARTEAVVLSHPVVAQFAAAGFEQSWSRGIRFEPTGPVDAAAAVGDAIRETIKRLVAEGMTDSQIGRRVGLKPRAVQNRIRQIKQEMGVESRSELCFLLGQRFDNGANADPGGARADTRR